MSDKRNLKLLLILKRYSAGTGEGERRVFFKNKYSEKPASFNKKFSVSVSKMFYVFTLWTKGSL